MNDFAKAVAQNIRTTITKIKRQGTVGMGVANLRQITPTPSPSLDGAPAGPAGYGVVFANVIKTINVHGFRIY